MCKIQREAKMKVIILGCGRVGSTLARLMVRDGNQVTVVDKNRDAFRRLGPGFKGTTIIGNGTDEEILKKAGIETADAFVAVTNGDNTNIMSVQIAKTKFQVPKPLARIYDPIRACAYQEMGVDTLCTTLIGSRIIRDHLAGKELGLAMDYCSLEDEESVV